MIMTITTAVSAATAILGLSALMGCARAEARAGERRNAAGGTAAAEPAVTGVQAPAQSAAGADGLVDGLVEGTPAGGLGRWIGEVRSGLDSLPELARRDPAAAKNQALLLYVTRQEYLEIYYGTTGRAVKDAALAEAVMTAEARFHDLLRAVNTPAGGIDTFALTHAAAALGTQYDRVLQRAGALGIDPARLQLAAGGPR